jgi:hypothetical protein
MANGKSGNQQMGKSANRRLVAFALLSTHGWALTFPKAMGVRWRTRSAAFHSARLIIFA